MSAKPNIRLASALKMFSRLDAKLVVLAGIAVLTGWTVGNEALIRGLPGLPAMNPLTAACFVGAGLSLVCFWFSDSKPSLYAIGPFPMAFNTAILFLLVASGTSDDERRSRPNDSLRIITLQKPYGVEQLLECVGKALNDSTGRPHADARVGG